MSSGISSSKLMSSNEANSSELVLSIVNSSELSSCSWVFWPFWAEHLSSENILLIDFGDFGFFSYKKTSRWDVYKVKIFLEHCMTLWEMKDILKTGGSFCPPPPHLLGLVNYLVHNHRNSLTCQERLKFQYFWVEVDPKPLDYSFSKFSSIVFFGVYPRVQAETLAETIESDPLCITDLFQNKFVAYF